MGPKMMLSAFCPEKQHNSLPIISKKKKKGGFVVPVYPIEGCLLTMTIIIIAASATKPPARVIP